MTRTEKAVNAIIDRVEKNGQAYYIDNNTRKAFIIGYLLMKKGYCLIGNDKSNKIIVIKQRRD